MLHPGTDSPGRPGLDVADQARDRRGRPVSLLGRPGTDPGPLAEGLRPYPDGWRAHPPYQTQTEATLADPAGLLPHYPVISHRGGFPDGA